MKLLVVSVAMALAPALLSAQTATPATPKAVAPKAPPTLESAHDPVVLSVGDEKLTKSQFELLLAVFPEQVRANAVGPGKRKLAEQLADIMGMAQEARKRKLDQAEQSRLLLKFQADNVLAAMLSKDVTANLKPDDAAVHAFYDQHKADFEQVQARHILIRFKGSPLPAKPGEKELTDAEALAKAQDIRKKLLAGGDFAALAKTESADTTNADKGGVLPPFGHKQMVPEFEKAAFDLPSGQISEPVKTQFGYHIIKVDEHTTKSFDDVRAQIEPAVKNDLAKAALEKAHKDIPVTIDPTYFPK